MVVVAGEPNSDWSPNQLRGGGEGGLVAGEPNFDWSPNQLPSPYIKIIYRTSQWFYKESNAIQLWWGGEGGNTTHLTSVCLLYTSQHLKVFHSLIFQYYWLILYRVDKKMFNSGTIIHVKQLSISIVINYNDSQLLTIFGQ